MNEEEKDKRFSNVKIRTINGDAGRPFTEVFIDGRKIYGVRSVTMNHDSNKNLVPTITLELNALDFDIDGTYLVQTEKYGDIKSITFDDGYTITT